MQVVAVGMGLAGEHLAHIEAFQTAADALNFLQRVNFQTFRRECVAHLLGCEVEVNIFF